MTETSAIEAFSDKTGRRYKNWDALVTAESHGYTVVLISERPNTRPSVHGLFPDKPAAERGRVNLRRKAKRVEAPHKVHAYVRVVWHT